MICRHAYEPKNCASMSWARSVFFTSKRDMLKSPPMKHTLERFTASATAFQKVSQWVLKPDAYKKLRPEKMLSFNFRWLAAHTKN